MAAVPAARLLDLTRLASRAGRVLTGVDRVEAAYLAALLDDPVPAFGLVRTPLGYLLLEHSGLDRFRRAVSSGSWPKPGLIDRLIRRGDPQLAAVEALLRQVARGRSPHRTLGRMLRRHLPDHTHYLNVGQTTLRTEVLDAVRGLPGAKTVVMIHDTIPLDHPEWQRPGTPERLATRLELARARADLILTNSAAVAADLSRHLVGEGAIPPILPVHLGIDPVQPDLRSLPAGLDQSRPWFTLVSTIEPRKNHALILDVWEGFAGDPNAPQLVVIGGRGWNNAAVFDRLDARPAHVLEYAGLSDEAVAALVAGAHGSLNPTRAEGFGMPALEAAALGVPVLCCDLAIWREVLGDTPVYLKQDDRYMWKDAIERLARNRLRQPPVALPEWTTHFRTVLAAV